MARMPIGAGLDDIDDGPGDREPDLVNGRVRRAQDDDDGRRTPAADGATVILHDTEEERKEKEKGDPVTIIEGDQDDERLDAGQRDHQDDEDGDWRRSRRSSDRRQRRQAQRRARDNKDRQIARLQEQLDELRGTVAGGDRHAIQRDVGIIDGRISEAQRVFQDAEAAVARAVTASDGDEAIQAMRVRDEAAARLANMQAVKARAVQALNQPPAPKIDPTVAAKARDWMADNSWYDPNGGDEDSAIMLALDAQLTREGFRPTSDDFWEELTERGRKRLPHRFESDGDDDRRERRMERRTPRRRDDEDEQDERPTRRDERRPAERRGPPVSGGGSAGPVNGGGTRVFVDPEFKQSLIDAGIWDDPVRLRRALRNRADFDKRERERRAGSR